MASVQETAPKSIVSRNGTTLLEEMKRLEELQGQSGVRKSLNSELWHACAGPLVSLPQVGSLVYYFPQGHSEQVAVSTKSIANSHIPNYPNLPSQLLCQVHNVTLHADGDTDETYAQLTLQPVNSEKDAFSIPDFETRQGKQPSEIFCKTLTASDTSTHGGFSVPRRAAEKLFPPLDYSMLPPTQELVVRDLHDNSWTFRHIYRGQPKRHLLTASWSLFVGARRLKAGDSVLFIRDQKSQLLLGVRRANRQLTTMPSSVLSADSMHIGVLAAAAHAAANLSPFTVFYNPRACPSEFVIPFAKYQKALYGTHVSIGMRFGMMFETEESGKRRYMGTVVGISDLDPLKWPNSKWQNIQVDWDEPGFGERQNRVNLWEMEMPENTFICPNPISSFSRPFHPGVLLTGVEDEWENMLRGSLPQFPVNGNADLLYPLNPNISSELLKMIGPQISGTCIFGQQQPANAATIQTPVSYWLSHRRCTEPACLLNEPLQKREDTNFQTSLQQNHQIFLAQQQHTPLQEMLIQHVDSESLVEQSCVSDPSIATQNHKRPLEVAEESLVTTKSQGFQSKLNGHKEDQQVDKYECPFLQKTSLDKPELEHAAGTEPVQRSSSLNTLSPSLPEQLHTEVVDSPLTTQNPVNHPFRNQDLPLELLTSSQHVPPLVETNSAQLQQINMPILDIDSVKNNFLILPGYVSAQNLETGDLTYYSAYQSPTTILKSPRSLPWSTKLETSCLTASFSTTEMENVSSVINVEACNPSERPQFSCVSNAGITQCVPAFCEELSGCQHATHKRNLSTEHASAIRLDGISSENDKRMMHSISNSGVVRGYSDHSNCQSGNYSSFQFEASNGSTLIDPSISNACLEGFSTLKDSGFHNQEALPGSFNSNQDVQSQVTSASFVNSQSFSFQEFPENSAGKSSCNLDIDEIQENCLLHQGTWQQVPPPMRTYTKVQKLGSVGRLIDVTRFKDYNELKMAIGCMFGLEGQLDDLKGLGWKLVYVDYENDVLLVGDDPWEEFVSCVRCIRILSPTEVQQMSREGMQLE